MKLQEKEVSAYKMEHQNIAERLMREMPPFKEAEQLLELVQTHFSLAARDTLHPKVMILGSAFPEELVYAFGITPYWVLGGSLQTGAWAGELGPQGRRPGEPFHPRLPAGNGGNGPRRADPAPHCQRQHPEAGLSASAGGAERPHPRHPACQR